MFNIKTYNQISPKGLVKFSAEYYTVSPEVAQPDALVLRSQRLHDEPISDSIVVVGRAGAGTNNVPVTACSERGIVVMNAPGANANAVKELVLIGMLLACRNICSAWAYTQSLAGDDHAVWHKAVEAQKKQFKGVELFGRTLGIIGLGHIGVKVANAAVQLGMKVVGFDPKMTVNHAWMLSAEVQQAESIEEVMQQADFLSLHVPLNKHTENLIDAARLALLPEGAVVLNFAREGIINNAALKAALESGRLRSYVNDFPSPDFKGMANVITLPHLGASTREAEENCAMMIADQVKDFLENGNILNSVNFPNVKLSRNEGAFRVCIANQNVPNMVAQISHVIAESSANIIDMVNKSREAVAYTIIDVDVAVSDALVKKLAGIEGVLRVRVLG